MLSEVKIKAIQKETRFQSAFQPVISPDHWQKCLSSLQNLQINLSKIQSVPRLNGEWEYMFYLDLELNKNTKSEVIRRVLAKYTSNLEILGVYFKGDMLYES